MLQRLKTQRYGNVLSGNGQPYQTAPDTTAFVRAVAEALELDQTIGVVSWKRFAVVADANNAVGFTRYLANDYSFTPVLVIISEPIFRQEDKERIISKIQDLEYATSPKVLFLTDQYEINKAIREEENEITLLVIYDNN